MRPWLRTYISTFMSVVLVGTLSASHVAAQNTQNNRGLEESVRTHLERSGLLRFVNEIRADRGVVLLVGKVPDEATRNLVIETAFGVANVETVDSELEISPDAPPPPTPSVSEPSVPPNPAPDVSTRPDLPIGVSDDEIAEAVWARLKKDELDKELGDINVLDGVVTLKGKVRNAATRDKLVSTVLEVEDVKAVESDLEFIAAESAAKLVQDVVKAILRYPEHGAFDDIMVAEENGHVTLIGVVTEPFKKTDLEERVSKVFGVNAVDNQLRVLPVSPNDRDIRIRLFNAIYGDPMFRHFANRTNPPIHIIVEKGRVTLKGVVTNRVQKMKAGSIARSVFGIFRVDNQLQTGS